MKFYLDLILDNYMEKKSQEKRLFLWTLLLVIYILVPLFILYTFKQDDIEYLNANAVILCLIILSLLTLRLLGLIQAYGYTIIDQKSVDYLNEGIVEKKYDFDKMEKMLTAGKDTLPLCWITITLGAGLIYNMLAIVADGEFIKFIINNNRCMYALASLFGVMFIGNILMPNYFYYSFSLVNLKRLKEQPHWYEVEISDEKNKNAILYHIKCSQK
ncbi:MAG: hypothetical protein J6H31_06275 [Butyrivibrio sp.]|nr:hypothetical protein [Butyrivibrio sp.]